MKKAQREAQRRAKARTRMAAAAKPASSGESLWPGIFADPIDYCPDKPNHETCPATGSKHEWIKPHPRPSDHKYQCEACGHYDLDDYL